MASFCAGTDSPRLVLDIFLSVLQERLVPMFGAFTNPEADLRYWVEQLHVTTDADAGCRMLRNPRALRVPLVWFGSLGTYPFRLVVV